MNHQIAQALRAAAKSLLRASIADWRGTWLHYSKIPAVKINPRQFHQDPAGLYFFPEKFETIGGWTKYKYRFTADLSPSARVLDLSDLTFESAKALTREVTGEEPSANDFEPPEGAPSKFTTPSSRAWEAMRRHFLGKPGAWNKALQRAGYDAVFDDTGAIHVAEVQLLVLNSKVVKVTGMEEIGKGSGFAAIQEVSAILRKALKPLGRVKVTPPRKARVGFGSTKALQSKVEVKAAGKTAAFTVTISEDKHTVEVKAVGGYTYNGVKHADYLVGKRKWNQFGVLSPLENMVSFAKSELGLLDADDPQKLAAQVISAAEYRGRKVKLNKPFRTPDGPKKFAVYVKNDKGNVVKVTFGDPDMRIKKSDPERRKNFRARHRCDDPGPKWKARYWSCKAW